MNKKMTKVIGIVAVLALVAVAMVGAGAADAGEGNVSLYNGETYVGDYASISAALAGDGDKIVVNEGYTEGSYVNILKSVTITTKDTTSKTIVFDNGGFIIGAWPGHGDQEETTEFVSGLTVTMSNLVLDSKNKAATVLQVVSPNTTLTLNAVTTNVTGESIEVEGAGYDDATESVMGTLVRQGGAGSTIIINGSTLTGSPCIELNAQATVTVNGTSHIGSSGASDYAFDACVGYYNSETYHVLDGRNSTITLDDDVVIESGKLYQFNTLTALGRSATDTTDSNTIVVNSGAHLKQALTTMTTGTVAVGSNIAEITDATAADSTVGAKVTLSIPSGFKLVTNHLEVKGTVSGPGLVTIKSNSSMIIYADGTVENIVLTSSNENDSTVSNSIVLKAGSKLILKNGTSSVDDTLDLIKSAEAGAQILQYTSSDNTVASGKEFTADYVYDGTEAQKVIQTKNVLVNMSGDDSGKTVVGLTADVKYEVTIPPTVTLTTAGAAVNANYKINVLLAEGTGSTHKVVMKLTAAANDAFSVKRVGGDESLAYTFKLNGSTDATVGGLIVEKTVDTIGTATTVGTFTLSENPSVAGSYEDQLTFTVGFA